MLSVHASVCITMNRPNLFALTIISQNVLAHTNHKTPTW